MLVIWKDSFTVPQGHNSVSGRSTALCSVSKMVFPPVNYFLYSLVLSLALSCARPENLELSAQVQLAQSTHHGSVPIPYGGECEDSCECRVIFMALSAVGTVEMGSRWPKAL